MKAFLLGLAGLLLLQADAPEKYQILRKQKLVLKIQPLTAEWAPSANRSSSRLVVDPELGGDAEIYLLWPTADAPCRLRLRAKQLATTAPEGVYHIDLRAEAELADGTRVKAERTLRISESATALFEVYRAGDQVLTLALKGQVETETVVPLRPTVGKPVQFEVQVQRVLEGRAISLETNLLNTFVGEPVTYSFKLGEAGVADSVTLRLRPTLLSGNMAEIEVVISGMLPTAQGPQLISRTEDWVATRDTTSAVALELGEPPTGYRFLVTPRF